MDEQRQRHDTVEYLRVVAVNSGLFRTTFIDDRIEADYRKVQAECFPGWDGGYEVLDLPEPLGRYRMAGWRADVPEEHVRLSIGRYGPERAPDPRCRECGAPVDDGGEWIGEIH